MEYKRHYMNALKILKTIKESQEDTLKPLEAITENELSASLKVEKFGLRKSIETLNTAIRLIEKLDDDQKPR